MSNYWLRGTLGDAALKPPCGHVPHLNNFRSPFPACDSYILWLESSHGFSTRTCAIPATDELWGHCPRPPWGYVPHLSQLRSALPKNDSDQVWLIFCHPFLRKSYKCKKFTDDGQKEIIILIAHLSFKKASFSALIGYIIHVGTTS